MNEYEERQYNAILAWKKEEPGIIISTLESITKPVTSVVVDLVPMGLVEGAIEAANNGAKWLTDSEDIKNEGNVPSIGELHHKDLTLSDKLADNTREWAIGMAAAEGAVTGTGGLALLALDISAIVTLALRTIYKTGLCYGFESKGIAEQQFVLGILAVSGANNHYDKISALKSIEMIEEDIAQQVLEAVAEDSIENQLKRGGVFFTFKRIGRQLGAHLMRRKALQIAPLIGAVVGGSANASYMNDVGWAARRLFQERWLKDNHKIE